MNNKIIKNLGLVLLLFFSFLLGKSCSKPEIIEKEVRIELIKEVPVEKIVERKIYIKEKAICPDIQEKLVQQDEIVKIEKSNTVTYKKNRVYLSAGIGSDDYSVKDLGGGNYEVNQSYDEFTYGLGYQRSLNEKYNIGVQGLSNKTFLLNLGLDF